MKLKYGCVGACGGRPNGMCGRAGIDKSCVGGQVVGLRRRTLAGSGTQVEMAPLLLGPGLAAGYALCL